MKLITWNVNGIRAAQKNGFLKWFEKQNADVVCLQETKARQEQLDEELVHPEGYHSFWHSAQKPGYSGLVTYAKQEPLKVQYGIGVPEIDSEGRILITEFKDLVLINSYFPNSQREHTRLDYKLMFCAKMFELLESYRAQGKQVALCGDFNIAHKPIDLKNPKTNEDNAGYLPEERAWMDQVTQAGYIDTFRHFTQEPGHYTWWSYRPGVREKNIGWRLDYFLTNPEWKDRLKSAHHQHQVRGSDHCPVELNIR